MNSEKINKAMYQASDIGLRLEGLAFLLDSFRPEDYGPRDHIAIQGVGQFLKDLSRQAYEVSRWIDESSFEKEDKEAG